MTLVVVTGGAGFIGSHTVDMLRLRGYEVRIVDSLQSRVHPRGKPAWLPSEVDFIKGDVADRATMERALSGAEFALHLAAYQDYLPDFSQFMHTNAESTALILELVVSDRSRYPLRRLVVASSQAVAGEGKYRCLSEGTVFVAGPRPIERLRRGAWDIECPVCTGPCEPQLIDEETSNPHTAYGISKYALELLAFRLGARYGISTAAMRYTYVQGPRNSFFNAYSGIARRFALRIVNGLAPICYEDGMQMRDYVNVLDVARANVAVMESEADGLAFNVGGGRAVTVLEFAKLMLDAAGSNLTPLVPGEFRLGDTRHTVSDISRLRALGWEPTIPVEENIQQYLSWLDTQAGTTELQEAERTMVERGVVQRVVT